MLSRNYIRLLIISFVSWQVLRAVQRWRSFGCSTIQPSFFLSFFCIEIDSKIAKSKISRCDRSIVESERFYGLEVRVRSENGWIRVQASGQA
jgi:hypothetical protein